MELVLGIEDADAVMEAARRRVAEDEELDPLERARTEAAVTEDTAEALAYLTDPLVLVSEVPGVELQQASWVGEHIEYDPDSPDWQLDEDDVDGDDEEGDGDEGLDRREFPGFPG